MFPLSANEALEGRPSRATRIAVLLGCAVILVVVGLGLMDWL